MGLSKLNWLGIAIILYILYNLQGLLYVSGSAFSQFILLLFLIIGVICFISILLRRKNPAIVSLFIIFYLTIAIWYLLSPKTVVGTINEAIGEVSTIEQFKASSIFFMSFFVAYYSSINKNFVESNISKITLIFYVLATLRYLSVRDIHSDMSAGFTNNGGYYFVALLPYIPISFKRNNIMGIILLLVSMIGIFASAKRGAIVCLLISIVFAFIYYIKIYKKSFKRIVPALIILCCLAIVGYYSYISNDYLVARIAYTQEEGIGARSVAYSMLLNHWISDTNLLTFLFGNGSAATVEVWGNYAHNDWLEILIDYGLYGCIIYVLLFTAFFLYIKKAKAEFYYKLAMYICLIVWFLKTIFSMGYTDASNAYFMFLLGAIIGSMERQKKVMLSTYNCV